jgi:adenylyl-sulfate kinase
MHIFPQEYQVLLSDRIQRNQHKPLVLWLTGLSGSGKSTIANAVQNELFEQGKLVVVLDGDNIRGGLNRDLNFSDTSRSENIRRVAEVASLFANTGFIVIVSFISPFESDRQQAKGIIGDDLFREIYIEADLSICESRDVKGLYQLAREGKLHNFTGIDSPYQIPKQPDLTLNTHNQTLQQSANQLSDYISQHVALS